MSSRLIRRFPFSSFAVMFDVSAFCGDRMTSHSEDYWLSLKSSIGPTESGHGSASSENTREHRGVKINTMDIKAMYVNVLFFRFIEPIRIKYHSWCL